MWPTLDAGVLGNSDSCRQDLRNFSCAWLATECFFDDLTERRRRNFFELASLCVAGRMEPNHRCWQLDDFSRASCVVIPSIGSYMCCHALVLLMVDCFWPRRLRHVLFNAGG